MAPAENFSADAYDLNHYMQQKRTIKGDLRPSEAIYHKIPHETLRLLQKNELATFYSFDEIRKKLGEPQVDSDWLTL